MTHESISSQPDPELTATSHQEVVDNSDNATIDLITGSFQELENASLPELHSNDTEAIKISAWRGFFSRRREQFTEITQRVNSAFQEKFSHDIDGIHFTAQDMLKARFDPDFWKDVLRIGLGQSPQPSRAKSTNPFDDGGSYHAIIDNSVLRHAAYEQATAGNEMIADYLGENDRQFGQRPVTALDLSKETLAYFSGYAFVRKVGLVAALGVRQVHAVVGHDFGSPVAASRSRRSSA